ncbi:MAG: pro-sigmaK processing inhibitor BofA family protein [Bacilli bacterium]|nr:pro-sigmaK processing inhibitor BofA family protein [Bacilli bacterium]MDD3304652.1 pro-sigmaK processing inhibitor BofA family protein [Bacilli bacterium]MDD4053296.1 pro-sigmaK processing inhibitor BofA family protein [Bacilli bacterium]MDD4411363.1 pro-sigmaK processing inhibitor BofA family protein [Bacilli bacterium]
MIKKLISVLKRVILGGFILYGYNLMAAPLNLLIPINAFTLGLIGIFGISAIPFLALILIIAY